ncbi:MAG TPA: hypothetical protein VKE40_12665 [Gemmataceae bacterium]|nr:hypothetical protein [Gemmataceae bacterium]
MPWSSLLSRLALPVVVACLAAGPARAEEIEVKVLAILVSEHHTDVHPKLKEFAKEVLKKDPSLTGFRLERTTAESLELGQTRKFPLVNGQVVEVTVNKERNEKGRVTLTIKPPKLDQITYECACDKFFSMATQHYVGKGMEKQQLFIAVMAKPCLPKKDK